MAYLPPLNGGRVNVTIGGNTGGAGALISSGTMSLVGGNNITLQQAGNTLSIVGPNAAAASVNFSAGTTSGNLAAVTFANNASVSFGLNAGTITASHNGLTSQSNQALSAGNGSFAFQTASFSNANGISFSTSAGSAIIASHNAITSQSAQTQSNIQAIYGSNAAVTASTGTVAFNNGNGISFGLNGNTMTASHNALTSQSAQALSGSNGSFAFQTAVFSNSNGVSFGTQNGSVMTASHNGITSQTLQTSNVIQALSVSGGNSAATGTIVFSNTNGVSFGLNGNTLTASAAGGGGGVAIAGGGTTYTSGTANLSAAGGAITIASTTGQALNFSVPATSSIVGVNGITVSTNGSTISVSGPGVDNGVDLIVGARTFSSGSLSIVDAGGALTINTSAGPSLNFSVPQTSQLTGTGAISIASVGSTISIGAPIFDFSISGSNTFGTAGSVSNGLILVGGNNISLSQSTNTNGATVTVNGGAGGGGGGGIALTAPGTSYTSGTVNFSVMTNAALTITGNNSVLSFSAPGTSALSGTGAVSMSTAGSTVLIGAPSITTLSRWEYPENIFTNLNSASNGRLSLQHMYVPFNVVGGSMKIAVSLSLPTFTTATTASINNSLWMGIYTLNGSTLELASSGSANNAYSWGNTANAGYTATINGLRQFTVPAAVNMTPGEYWVAAALSSATTFTSTSNQQTIMGNNQYNATGVVGIIGSSTSAGRDIILGQGYYSAVTSAGPATVALSDINNTSASAAQRAAFYHAIFNTTY